MHDPDRTKERWLAAIQDASDRVFVGLDHHSRQVTVAAAAGAEFIRSAGSATTSWIPTAVFDQDGLGYPLLAQWLHDRFPNARQEDFTFVAEPTFSKPLARYLVRSGFTATEIKWVGTAEVGPYRKAKGVGLSGKNDHDDARTMAMMAFEVATSPFSGRGFLPGVRETARAEALRRLAADHARLTATSVALQNQIWDLVTRLFPECWRIWNRSERVLKPDGTSFERQKLTLFRSMLPAEVLSKFPSASAIAQAGFDTVWATVGRKGIRRQIIQDLVLLAEQSAGIDEPLDADRLGLVLGEYQEVQARLASYRQRMEAVIAGDPVLASLRGIPNLGPQTLAILVGALGDVSRFPDVDAAKRYLNIAPVPMPQTGTVDQAGRPVQAWRLPANS